MEETLDDSHPSELFMELGSESRYAILESLGRKPAKLSSLSRKLNITVQDAYRNLNRLTDEGLVRRSDGVFYLTEYGMAVMKLVSNFLVMKKYSRFFEDHSLVDVVPNKFLHRIGALYNTKTVNSATAVFQSLKKMQSSATDSLRVIVSQAWPEEGEIFIDRANHGAKIMVVAGRNTVFPKNVMEQIVPRIEELVSKGLVERRMVDKVDIALFIADNREAAIAFPNTKGEVDMTALFTSEDPAFCEWCSDYFDHIWKESRRFDEKQLKVVDY